MISLKLKKWRTLGAAAALAGAAACAPTYYDRHGHGDPGRGHWDNHGERGERGEHGERGERGERGPG